MKYFSSADDGIGGDVSRTEQTVYKVFANFNLNELAQTSVCDIILKSSHEFCGAGSG